MKLTSAEANKLLRKVNEEYAAMLRLEECSREFNAAVGEDIETVRPEYDYKETREKLKALEGKTRKIKHAINIFNNTHIVDGFNMTIDELLIYIPQLARRKEKLAEMSAKLPKARVNEDYRRRSNIIDYTYINYDLGEVKKDLEAVTDELARAQIALDVLNTSTEIELDL